MFEWACVGHFRRYRLLGHAAQRSGDDGKVLHRGCNPQVFGEEHCRLGDGNRRDFCAHQSDPAGAGVGEYFSVGQRSDLS